MQMNDKIKMRDGDTMLIMVMGGEVIHFTPNMSLPHSEFVKRRPKSYRREPGSGPYRSLKAKSQRLARSTFSVISFRHHRKLLRLFGGGSSEGKIKLAVKSVRKGMPPLRGLGTRRRAS